MQGDQLLGEREQLTALGDVLIQTLSNPNVRKSIKFHLQNFIIECRQDLKPEDQLELKALEIKVILPQILVMME